MHCDPPVWKNTLSRRINTAVTLQQASLESPSLATLVGLVRESTERLQSILPLLPAGLRSTLRAGPIVGSCWHLLADSSAAAAKMRQHAPALLAHLRSQGRDLEAIQIKVLPRSTT
jgi:hypothetical protein